MRSHELTDKKNRLLDRVQGYAELSMYREALAESRRLVKAFPDDPSLFFELALGYEDVGQMDKAIACYRYAIRRLPGDSQFLSRAYTNLGYCYKRHLKRHDLAMVCYEKSLELDPLNEWALNNIAAILKEEGRWEESLAYYAKAHQACMQKYESVCSKIRHNLAYGLYLCREYEQARDMFSVLADECPEKYYVLSDYGCVCYRMGDFEKAWDLFEKAHSMYPKVQYYGRLCRLVRRKLGIGV